MHLAVDGIRYSSIFVADVKCGLYEINKNNRANAIDGQSLVREMFLDRTEAMLTSICTKVYLDIRRVSPLARALK